jgi:hypothetical protein
MTRIRRRSDVPVMDYESREEFEALLREAYELVPEVADQAGDLVRLGQAEPLGIEEARRVLTAIAEALRDSDRAMADPRTRSALRGDLSALIDRVAAARDRLTSGEAPSLRGSTDRMQLASRETVPVGPVFPRPTFHGRQVAMNQGFVRVRDIGLWDQNERLEIHLAQFRQQEGRSPRSEELLDIMLSRLQLPGVADDQRDDQFKILDLARSIAANGVRRPPIIDLDGTLLDGNRRVAACLLILDSSEFGAEQKRRAEWVFVWQLTEHADDADRDAVVVSMNFESDNKEPWPEYIKARKVADAWQEMLEVLPRIPTQREQAQMKRELSRRFALGPDTATVSRYLKMVAWAQEFEDHHISRRDRDPYEVQHRASRYFQYFDELAKGERPGGVAYALKEDDRFRDLVFDLLFDGKFRNWRQIRDLKYVYNDEDAYDELKKAREADDIDDGQEHLDNAVSIARLRRGETRSLGANTRIEQFVSWLEDLPVSAFRDTIRPENLRKLHRALALVSKQVEAVLGGSGD